MALDTFRAADSDAALTATVEALDPVRVALPPPLVRSVNTPEDLGTPRVRAVRMRAAVLEEFGQPLEVQEVELAEPREGEVLVRLEACGVCHTDLYTASGADPSGYAPAVLGHEGCGIVEAVGEGVRDVAPGDRVVTLFSPQCRECIHCLSPRTNLCLAIREEQNKGHLPDGTVRLSRGGEPIRHFMGTSTFAEYTVMPEIALAKVDPEAAPGPGRAVRLRPVHRPGRGHVHGGRAAGLDLRGVRRRAWSAWAPWPAAGCRARSGSCAWTSSQERLELARGQGATDVMIGRPDAVAEILEMTGGFGADYTFEATGNVAVMRQAVEAARMGWGLCTVAGVAGKGETLDVVPRFLITGRRIAGSSFGGVKGRDQVPELVRRYLDGRHRRGPLRLPPHDAGRRQPRLRADGGPRRDKERDRVLVILQRVEHPDWLSNAYFV